MPAQNFYKPKEKEKSIYSSSSVTNIPHTAAAGAQNAQQNNVWNAAQSTPSLQSSTPQKSKREKSPSELGEEVVRVMLSEEMQKEQRPAAKEKAPVQPLANTGPERNAFQPPANANPGEPTFQSAQRSNYFTSPQQMFGGTAGSAYAAPAWQPLAAAQAPATAVADRDSRSELDWQPLTTGTTQNLNETAPNGSASGDPAYIGRLPAELQQTWEPADPTQPASAPAQPTPDWMSMAVMQDLTNAGVDIGAMQAGLSAWDTFNQLLADTHLAPGTTFGDYLWDEIKSGAYTGMEGAWNGLVDLGEANGKAWLQAQNVEMQQQALFNDAYREQAERNNMQTREASDELAKYSEGLRSHKAAEYAQQIDELYDAGGFFRIGGDIASGIGQMAPTIAVNVLTGGTGGMPYLYLSAAGNAAAEARANGADEETALLYGMLSGSVEVLTEQLGEGIPGLDKKVLNNWLMGMAESNVGRAALQHVLGALGEGAEEFISEIAGAYFAQMWNGDERGALLTLWETLPDAFYAGFVGMMTSACMSVPGNLAETYNAYTVDTAMNAMKNGETLSGTQLANAERAMQKLSGPEDAESRWSGLPAEEWKNAKSSYLNSFFPQMAELTGNGADFSGIDLSNLIMLPTGKDLAALANQAADSNPALSSTMAGPAAAQNGQQDLSNLIHFPTGEQLAALVNEGTDPDGISSLAANDPAALPNGQQDLSNLIHLPTGEQLAALVNEGMDPDGISSLAANDPATLQNGQQDPSNLIHFPTGEQLAAQVNEGTDSDGISSLAANDPAMVQNGQPDLSNLILFPTGEQLAALVNEGMDPDAVSSTMANGAAVEQSGPYDSASTTHLPTGAELAAQANTAANPDSVSSSTTNGAATAQNSPFDVPNAISFLTGNEIAADQNRSKTAGDNFQQTDPLRNAEIESELLAQDIERGIDAQEREIEMREAEADERNGLIEQKSETLSKEDKSGMLSVKEIQALGKALVHVSHPSGSFLLNSDQKITLRKAYRQMLTYAKNLARNTEVDMLFRMDMTLMDDGFIVGEPGAGRVTYEVPNEDFISVHNHPDGRTFSEDDIRNIITCGHQRIVIAVGHNGNVYVLEKHPDFKGTRAALAYKFYLDFIAQHPNRAQNAETYIATMEELIKGVEKYGIFYFSR